MGIELLAQIALKTTVMAMTITAMLVFIGIGALVVMHAFVVSRALRKWSSTTQRLKSAAAAPIFSAKELENLPSFEYGGEQVMNMHDCAVCLEGFKGGELCRLLPGCTHSFHAGCVDSWLLRAPVCPLCRNRIDRSSAVYDGN